MSASRSIRPTICRKSRGVKKVSARSRSTVVAAAAQVDTQTRITRSVRQAVRPVTGPCSTMGPRGGSGAVPGTRSSPLNHAVHLVGVEVGPGQSFFESEPCRRYAACSGLVRSPTTEWYASAHTAARAVSAVAAVRSVLDASPFHRSLDPAAADGRLSSTPPRSSESAVAGAPRCRKPQFRVHVTRVSRGLCLAPWKANRLARDLRE